MWRATRIFGRRWRQPPPVRWLEASALFGVAFVIRLTLGPLHWAIPFLSFYPAILLAAGLLGWKEATFVLILSGSAAWYFFLPPDMSFLPIGWGIVGFLNIIIITMLRHVSQELAEANERQKVLFQELQHRVANTLQSAIGKLEIAKRRMSLSPEAANMLEEAIRQMFASADIHRRLHDPVFFSNGLEPMLREVLATVIDLSAVNLNLDIEELALSLDQKSIIAMLVIEVANNSVKHVFQRNFGSRLDVTLRALPARRAMLSIRDDGPGTVDSNDARSSSPKLGMQILRNLTDQIHGILTINVEDGRKLMIEFPTFTRSDARR